MTNQPNMSFNNPKKTTKKIFRTILFGMFGVIIAWSSLRAQNTDFSLGIVIPEQDTVEYSYSRYRVAANTHPEAQAFINGKEVKVYSSGAFVDMVFPESDITPIEFKVILKGDTLVQTRYLITSSYKESLRKESSITQSNTTQTRESIPNKKWFVKEEHSSFNTDQWYGPNDVIQLSALATPGAHVYAQLPASDNKIKLHERSTPGRYHAYVPLPAYTPFGEGTIEYHVRGKWFKRASSQGEKTLKWGGLPKKGVVNSSDAYLNIGLGSDRLGGAKYGSLYKGVQLTIVGEVDGLYNVQLSPSLHAWIPTRFVDLEEEYYEPESILTGNIRISGPGEGGNTTSNHDMVMVSLAKRLPYIVHTEVDPNLIIVDVFGATSNTNWKIHYDHAQGINEVRWQQVEDDRFRLIIELSHKRHWGYDVQYGWGGQMQILIKHPPVIEDANQPLKNRIIAVDAGHGGRNNGSLGATGTMEKEVTLAISKKLQELLEEAGAKVVMTRTDDSYLYMSERAEIIRSAKSELLVSIHANSIGYATDPVEMKGTGAFYKHMAYKPLAEVMYKKMRELGFADYGLTGSFNFSLNAPTDFPNVLVETAFMSNPEEEIILLDPYYQRRMAAQIVEGLIEYYNAYAAWPYESLEIND